jgi:hypothetical protein
MSFARIVHDDEAENSIMQTITIAVSAILIAAGLVTAPGLINNARDSNATGDLANIATGEEFYIAQTGEYSDSLLAVTTQDNARVVLSSPYTTAIIRSDDGKTTVTFAYSKSGKMFWRSSDSSVTHSFNANDWVAGYPAPAGYPSNVDFPATYGDAKWMSQLSDLSSLAHAPIMTSSDGLKADTTYTQPTQNATMFVVSRGTSYTWFDLNYDDTMIQRLILKQDNDNAATVYRSDGVYQADNNALNVGKNNVIGMRYADGGDASLLTKNGITDFGATADHGEINNVSVRDGARSRQVVTFPKALSDSEMKAVQQYLQKTWDDEDALLGIS